MSNIVPRATYPILIPLAAPFVYVVSEYLGVGTYPYTVADLLDSHLLQRCLVHFQQVFTSDIVLPEDLNVLAAVDALQPFADASFIPILH